MSVVRVRNVHTHTKITHGSEEMVTLGGWVGGCVDTYVQCSRIVLIWEEPRNFTGVALS